jgi:hypothetical protein
MGNLDNRPIGKCSQCGGIVSVPTYFHSVNRPLPTCERCGAVADETSNLPVIKTIGGTTTIPKPRGYYYQPQ